MSTNRSTAVMQRRRVAPDSLDYFPTPPWATRALCEQLQEQLRGGMALADLTCWEPACGEMHMVRPLAEYFGEVIATDVHRYGDDHELFDFTLAKFERRPEHGAPDFVITNPPFRLAADFVAAASAATAVGFAMLVRSAFLEGRERYETLFSKNPPTLVLQFVERVAMVEGRLDGDASSATAYCWLVWLHRSEPDTHLRWIRPCRLRLERREDYPDYPIEVLPPPTDGLFGDVTEARV
jgi:hypothetical protein